VVCCASCRFDVQRRMDPQTNLLALDGSGLALGNGLLRSLALLQEGLGSENLLLGGLGTVGSKTSSVPVK
jgi:hypothetical protein